MAYLAFFLSFSTFSSTTIPLYQDRVSSVIRSLSSDSSAETSSSSSFDACNAHFKDYVFPELSDNEYYKKKYPIAQWSCIYSGEAFELGYNNQIINENGVNESNADNKIIYDYKNKSWESVPDQYYKNTDEPSHLELIKIKGKNYNGYMVINKKKKLRDAGDDEGFYFCIIHNYNALCGSGENVQKNGKFISYQDALKLLGSISFDEK